MTDIDLDLSGPRASRRVVVAMSGGVDSSVAAALVAQAGYETVGITLQLYDHGQATAARAGSCCAGQDVHDARRVAESIGIPHYVLDYESRFRQQVIEDFADAYARGETPIPCVRCNERVKFRDLLETARDLGADALVTGHYVRRVAGQTGPSLLQAVDASRDQSYFLFATTREQLAYLRFPLGGMDKAETRDIARELGLGVAEKADSQDICFVPNGRYRDVVARLRPEAAEPGDIVHMDGTTLGRHNGIAGFTIGQRKGLGIGGRRGEEQDPLYVIRLVPEARQVVVGPRTALGRNRIRISETNWLESPDPAVRYGIKVRNTMAPVTGRLSGDGGTILLDEPLDGVSPGQAAVVYRGDRVIGGGWIRAADLSSIAA